MAEIKDLQAKMAAAIANNDTKAIEEISAEIVKGKGERHKAEVEAQRKEAEAMAGDREKLGKTIHEAIKGMFDKELAKLKVKGYQYKLADDTSEVAYTGLIVATMPKSKGSGNGGAGKTKEEFGMSLSEVYEKYHTAEDDVNLADATAKDATASANLGKVTNSNQWRVKNEVKKRAIANKDLAPAK